MSSLFSSIHHYIFFLWLQRSIGQPKVIFLQISKNHNKKTDNQKEKLEDIPYFIDQSPRRLIISLCRYLRRLFEGGDYSRAASISSSTPNFLAALLLVLCSAQLTALSLNAAS